MSALLPGQKLISASLLRLRVKSPFFATLALFTRFVPTQQHPSAATDGRTICYNLAFLSGLSSPQRDGLLLHEVLHAALLHPLRCGVREKTIWNIAADIVVNGIIAKQSGFELPEGGLRYPQLEDLSVEEVYELLLKKDKLPYLQNVDLLYESLGGENSSVEQGSSSEIDDDRESKSDSDRPPLTKSPADLKAHCETHWKNALQQAALIARTSAQGTLPAGIEREMGQVSAPQLDWRAYLWRYLVQTPTDFQGFDRRFVYQGLYLEALQGESVSVYLCIDSSGSIDDDLLALFFGEVLGILSAYPQLTCELYYADAALYGPYEIDAGSQMPPPEGGGGTSFIPFFERVRDREEPFTQGVCIYLTDGYGSFPDDVPTLPVLWVVTPGGLALEAFPFGESVRLLSPMSN